MARKEKVTRVIDGDTFETSRRKHPVRLAGVNAPEKRQPGYQQAKANLERLVGGKKVTGEVLRLLTACDGVLARQELQTRIGIRHDEHFRLAYMTPALAAGLIEMTIPASHAAACRNTASPTRAGRR